MGYGKSLIYQLAPSVSKHLGLLSEVPIVLVISPLNALIDDQIASVTKLGITACKLDASSLEDTVSLAGHEILFTSPEVLETGAVSIKHGLRTADYRLRTGYKIRTRYKTRTGKYGLGIQHGLGIKRGLQTVDWV